MQAVVVDVNCFIQINNLLVSLTSWLSIIDVNLPTHATFCFTLSQAGLGWTRLDHPATTELGEGSAHALYDGPARQHQQQLGNLGSYWGIESNKLGKPDNKIHNNIG